MLLLFYQWRIMLPSIIFQRVIYIPFLRSVFTVLLLVLMGF
jgi:hypothetical protein